MQEEKRMTKSSERNDRTQGIMMQEEKRMTKS